MRHRLLWIGLVVAATLVTFSSGSAFAQTPTPTPTATATPVPLAACPAGATLAVAQQSAGSSSVVVTVTPSTTTIKPAADGDFNSFHLHYYIDKPIGTLKPGDVIPSGDLQIVHSGATTLDLKLAAGSHTIVVVLGGLTHMACGNAAGAVVMGTATFTVAAQATPTPAPVTPTSTPVVATPVPAAAPKTGSAGLAGDTSSSVAMALLAATVALVAGGAAVTRRSR